MNKIKIYQLKNIKDCKFKAYMSEFNEYKTLNNKSKMIKQVYKDIILGYGFETLSNLQDVILEKLDDKYFITKEEKLEEVIIILNYIKRYFEYEGSLNRKVIAKNVYGSVNVNGKAIDLRADIVFESKDKIELIKYKTSATKLSYKARTAKNLPQNEIELYLLKQLGEQLYSKYNKPIVASFYHLKGKNEDKDIYKLYIEDKSILIDKLTQLESIHEMDKKAQKEIDKQIKEIKDVLYFNNSIGNNIISFDFDTNLDEEIKKLLNTKLDSNSEKCKSADCEFCNYSTLCNYSHDDKRDNLELVKSIKKASTEVKLSEAQKQVINTEEGDYRINACCGAGKSTTMVMRTIELIKKGYSLNDILLITFTNKGCEELKEKISYWLNYYEIKNINKDNLNIYTFNSFGESIVSKEWNRLGFTKKPELATLIDINDTIKEILEENSKISWLNYKNPLLNYPNAKGAFKQLLIYFNAIKSFDYTIDTFITNVLFDECSDVTTDKLNSKAKVIFDLYENFNRKLKDKNLLQYQDQILYLIQLFESYPDVINTYGYKHIIVDEYQDTDFSQVKLLHLLESYMQFKSLMVVGDSSQAIYGFRNTTPENIINFDKQFKDTKDIFLLENYRSTPQICNVANNLDKLNTLRIDKEIISKKADGAVPKLLKCKSLESEYKHISDLIEDKINNGIPKHEICFIARTKKELLEFQTYLNNKNIPNILEVSELYIDNQNVQVIVNLANFFKNNEYDYYLLEYLNAINTEFITLDNDTIKQIVNDFKVSLINEFAALENEEEKITYFYNIVTPVIEKDIIARTFIENLQAKTFYTFNEFLSYLYKIVLYKDDTSIEKDDNKYNAVVLTTAHSSKGKEWSVVFNSINSYKYEDTDNEALEEERRLLFVSITRAKDELYISYNTNEDKPRNKGKYVLFADELIGVEKIEVVE